MDVVVIIVEGETERVFYEALVNYYRSVSKETVCKTIIYNIKGIGNFSNKAIPKIKNGFKKKIEKDGDTLKGICCAYDTDVFELKQKPPVDWKKIETRAKKELKITSAQFVHVKAQRMIEDWFLYDLENLCNYLKIEKVKNLNGKDANEKMKVLFKKASKFYVKGNYTEKFIPSLDIEKIINKVKESLRELEVILNVKYMKS